MASRLIPTLAFVALPALVSAQQPTFRTPARQTVTRDILIEVR